jgi:UDP:flavonoid glycosyltransferase YjiC (YdhE family)
MGSSGTPAIVARIVESFEGKPYHVIAPIKFQLARVPGVRVPKNVLVTDWLPELRVSGYDRSFNSCSHCCCSLGW